MYLTHPGAILSRESYKTVKLGANSELRVKGSVFVGHLSPAPNKRAADAFVTRIRTKYADATHNCFAWRVGHGPLLQSRADDDGEPGGSAGRPILQALEARELFDAVIVVTRYYGGTKLGVGGLIRAYAGCAFAAIDAARIVEVVPQQHFALEFGYAHEGAVKAILQRLQGRVVEANYSEVVGLSVSVPMAFADEFQAAFRDATGGRGRCDRIEGDG